MIYFIFLILITTSFSNSFLVDKSSCSSISDAAERMRCLHEAAVSAAYLCNTSPCPDAVDLCNQVWFDFKGVLDPAKVETESNLCFADIAEKLGDPSLCDQISDLNDDRIFGSSKPLSAVCKDKATKIQNLRTYTSRGLENSLCTILFILPLFYLFIHKL